MSKFEVLILGSSSALPAFGRHPAAQLINIHEQFLLIDCGEGAQSRLVQYGQKLHRIQAIFISHLHGDHYFGLPGILTSLNLLGRKDPLDIVCPPGLEELIRDIVHLGRGEMRYTIHWHTLNHQGLRKVLDHAKFEVLAFPLQHRIPTYGFIVAEKAGLRNMIPEKIEAEGLDPDVIRTLKNGRTAIDASGKIYPLEEYTKEPMIPRRYAYASDTLYCQAMVPYIQGVDLLYHESTYLEELTDKALENFHSTALQAAQIATQAGVKKLLLGHFSSRYKTLDAVLQEAVNVFPNSALALEGERFQV